MSHDHVDPLFQGILNAISGQMETVTALRTDIKLKRHMSNTNRLTKQQAEALNKLLDLVHDLIQEVHDEHKQDRYERKYQLILDRLFPERLEWRKRQDDE